MKNIKIAWEWIKFGLVVFGAVMIAILFLQLPLLFKKSDGFKKLVNDQIKKTKKKSDRLRREAGALQSKAHKSNNKRKKIRDKYSKAIPVVLLLMLLPSLLSAKYIVWDPEDKVNRDYGTITNYVMSLEEEKIIFLATQGYLNQSITYYSNAYDELTNVVELQQKYIEAVKPAWYEWLWDKSKFWIGLLIGGSIVYVAGR